tara:strand:- start:1425 stop:1613 length:189 start_codon:yes stop_codon:yes gene_type:complete
MIWLAFQQQLEFIRQKLAKYAKLWYNVDTMKLDYEIACLRVMDEFTNGEVYNKGKHKEVLRG